MAVDVAALMMVLPHLAAVRSLAGVFVQAEMNGDQTRGRGTMPRPPSINKHASLPEQTSA